MKGLTVQITDKSTDKNSGFALGDSWTYDWNFGDSATTTVHATSTGVNNISHTYSTSGSVYSIWLTVTDAFGLSSATSTSIMVPTLTSIAITTPATKLTYTVGEALDISGLIVTGTYTDMSTMSTSTESITTSNISGFNSSAATSSQRLTVTVGSATTTYLVTINPASNGGGGGGGGTTYKRGDINKDGTVDEYDFAIMMSQWEEAGLNLTADLNDDNIVNEYDLAILMDNWD